MKIKTDLKQLETSMNSLLSQIQTTGWIDWQGVSKEDKQCLGRIAFISSQLPEAIDALYEHEQEE